MTQDEIIEMARQAGLDIGIWEKLYDDDLFGYSVQGIHENLQAFAKLVEARTAAKEREKSNRLLWLFQEWKEDHLSQHNYIEAVEAIRARGEA